MKRLLVSNPFVQRLRRSQRGQSVLLMAFAFIALVAFVGLVTDVTLLFVRYGALRRAVDSAAIAAAGQIRENTDYSDVTIAAQQYIQLHGLNPDSVLVETCETDIYQWREGKGAWAGQPHPESMYGKPVSKHMPSTELCDWANPRKLARVSAQIKSETTFLSLLGIEDITLEATSVSETAVLDVALVIDTSESMAKETTRADLEAVGLVKTGTTDSLAPRKDCQQTSEWSATNPSDPYTMNYAWGGCCNDPGVGNVGDGSKQSNNVVVPNGLIWNDRNKNGLYDGASENGVLNNSPRTVLEDAAPKDGKYDSEKFVYDTLVCKPFKEVRDAARLFVKRLDFVRGDRVVFITFDRTGTAYDPDGPDKSEFRPLIRSEATAIQVLNSRIGILIQTDTHDRNTCYRMVMADRQWDQWYQDMNNGLSPETPDWDVRSYESVAPCGQTNIGGGILTGNNALTDPADIRREAVWVMILLTDGAANTTDKVNPASGTFTEEDYGYWGYCPWATFCNMKPTWPDTPKADWPEPWPKCSAVSAGNPDQVFETPVCNDDDPKTRHIGCINFDTRQAEDIGPECIETGNYDADDYARDMADFAGLIKIAEGKPGNFIAMFSIGFGREVADEMTGAPLLRYIADAGDNGVIDNDWEQDLRDDGLRNNSVTDLGQADPCQPYNDPYSGPPVNNPYQQCGQYYYASGGSSLSGVFEDIASRLFTRLAR